MKEIQNNTWVPLTWTSNMNQMFQKSARGNALSDSTLVCFPSPPRCKYLELLHQDKQRATHSYSVRFNYTVCAGKGSFAAPWLSFNAASHLTYLSFLFLGLMKELCCLFWLIATNLFCLPVYHLLLSGGVQATGRVTVSLTRSILSEWYRDVTHLWMGLWKPVWKPRRFHSTRPPGSSGPFFKLNGY